MPTLTWKSDERKYGNGERLYAGKYPVAGAYYDGTTARDDPKKYMATTALPGLKAILGCFETLTEAKSTVERAVTYWFTQTEKKSE